MLRYLAVRKMLRHLRKNPKEEKKQKVERTRKKEKKQRKKVLRDLKKQQNERCYPTVYDSTNSRSDDDDGYDTYFFCFGLDKDMLYLEIECLSLV